MQALSSAFRKFGALDGFLYLVNAAAARVAGSSVSVRRYHFMAQPLDVKLPLPRRLGAEYVVRFVPEEESAPFPRPAEVIRARYQSGSVCIGAYRAEQLVGFIWFVAGPYEEDEVRCRYIPQPAESTAWDYDLYVAPEFRNGIVLVKLWSAVMEHLKSRGIAWSLSRISAFSPESLAAHRRMKAARIGSAMFVQVLGAQLMLGSVVPYCHLSLRSRSGPDLRLRAPS